MLNKDIKQVHNKVMYSGKEVGANSKDKARSVIERVADNKETNMYS
jgi:hypothetical protein